MRPIFHRKGDRIKAHLDICFITYTLARQLMYRYRLQQGEKVELESGRGLASRASYDVLRDELAQTEFSLRSVSLPLASSRATSRAAIYTVFSLGFLPLARSQPFPCGQTPLPPRRFEVLDQTI